MKLVVSLAGAALGGVGAFVFLGWVSEYDRHFWMVLVSSFLLAVACWDCRKVDARLRTWLVVFQGLTMGAIWLEAVLRSAFPDPPVIRPMQLGFLGGAILALLVVVLRVARTKVPRNFWWILGVVLASWLIAFFSGRQGAPGHFPSWLETVLGLDKATADVVSTVLRKIVHFVFYGCVGWSAFRGVWGGGAGRNVAIVAAVLLVGGHAAIDEGRQTTTSVRSGSAWDVLLDLLGATVFLTVGLRARNRKSLR